MPAYIRYPEWLSPVIIPGLPFRWYGVMYLVAFVIAYLLFMRQVRERQLNIDSDEVLNFFFWAIVGLVLGARIMGTLVYHPEGYYLRNPHLIFWPFDTQGKFTGFQGLSFHGGLLGAVIAIVIYARVRKIDVLDWGDMLVAGIPLGYTFGRLGNFINGELYGRVTTVPWGMVFPNARGFSSGLDWVRETVQEVGMQLPAIERMINLPRHPSQLYEALFEGIFLWLILWFIVRRHRPFRGFTVAVYMIGYGFVRFIIEYFREPDYDIGFPLKWGVAENPPSLLLTPWNFTTGQILNALMIAAGIALIFIFRHLESNRLRTLETPERNPTVVKKTKRKR